MVHVDVEGDLGPQVKVAGELAGPFDAHLIGIASWAPTSVFLAEDALKDPMPPIPPLQDIKSALDERGRQFRAAVECKNTAAILRAAGLNDHFDACVDGLDAEALKLPGKPDPALFLETAHRLRVEPLRAVVFEDALAGVEAGKRGHFGCVVGIARGQQSMALRQHGADVVIKSLQDVHVKEADPARL
jgi:beta-phosphoglucomutase-like phosphatase (HAD superfamily)